MAQIQKLDKKSFGSRLVEISDCPSILYCRGNIDLLNDKYLVAIVGSRRATSYGLTQTRKIAKEIAGAGVVVVSGLALGVDASAHRGALEIDGKTIAVLGTPIDQISPVTNYSLGQEILKRGGLIISEYAPGQTVYPANFARRNRIVAGLSQVVLVTEAAEKSGALITADLAMQYNRDVFALPGDVGRLNSVGPNNLIKNGAGCITDASDILEALGIEKEGQLKLKCETGESEVLEAILSGAGEFELILKQCRKPASELSALLLQLEIKGLIKNAQGKYLCVK